MEKDLSHYVEQSFTSPAFFAILVAVAVIFAFAPLLQTTYQNAKNEHF